MLALGLLLASLAIMVGPAWAVCLLFLVATWHLVTLENR